MDLLHIILALGIVSVSVVAMAVGVIVSGKELKGSCGGVGNLLGLKCFFCDKKDECEELFK